MILVTGGAGYVATHTLVELHNNGYKFVVYDNLSNSSVEAIKRVERIIGQKIDFEIGDIRDKEKLHCLFLSYKIDSVIHFTGLKAVGESVEKPLEYYDNNVNGNPQSTPIKEDFPVGATTNPYGTSKYMIERILQDVSLSDANWKIAILRYFNPVGAHESSLIGEDPNGIPNNLMPFITQVAVGKRGCLNVFGGDYDTKDGTGVRDYIHVVDLANAHVKAIKYLEQDDTRHNPLIVNIGTGIGYSVLDMVKASKRKIPYKIVKRREGDIAECYSDPSFAEEVLGFKTVKTIKEMCADSWQWQNNNPNGYKEHNC